MILRILSVISSDFPAPKILKNEKQYDIIALILKIDVLNFPIFLKNRRRITNFAP